MWAPAGRKREGGGCKRRCGRGKKGVDVIVGEELI
jgi:hypothetical protein